MLSKLLLLLIVSVALSAEIHFSVSESYGRNRINEGVSGGMAFKKGEVTSLSQLALFRNGNEIPAQFSPLVRLEDGSYQWVLVDFVETMNSGETKTYTLKTQSPTVSVPQPVSVSRSGSEITLDNGVITIAFDTVNFNGIQKMTYQGGDMISGSGGLALVDVAHSETPCVNGTVKKAGFVYAGPARATYRVEGEFYKDSCGGLGYSYLITITAGSPRIVLSVSARNSINESCGRHALLRYADARFALAFDPASTISYDTFVVGGMYNATKFWNNNSDTLKSSRAYISSAGKGLFVTEKMSGGNRPAYLGQTTLTGRDLTVRFVRPKTDTLMPIEDEAQQTSTIVLECFDGNLTQSGLRDMVYKAKGRLIARQDAAEVSEAGALSLGKFGTLADEEAAYAKWGWNITSKSVRQDEPSPTIESTIGLFGDTHEYETDLTGAWLLQWLRLGSRGFFDVAEGAAGYYRDQHVWRTTGFVHDGFNTLPGSVHTKSKRKFSAGATSLYGNANFMYDFSKFDAYRGVAVGDHLFVLGLSDYYCLTGDPDAKDAMVDIGEQLKAKYYSIDTVKIATDEYGNRSWGRSFTAMVRVYEITRDSSYFSYLKTQARKMGRFTADPNLVIKSGLNTSIGGFTRLKDMTDYLMPDSLKNYMRANRLQVFSQTGKGAMMYDSVSSTDWPIYKGINRLITYVTNGMDAYLRLGLDEDDDLRDRLIGIAKQVTHVNMSYCNQVCYGAEMGEVLVNYPRKGMISSGNYFQWNSAHKNCATEHGTSAGSFSPHAAAVYSLRSVNIPALAYRHSGHGDLYAAGKILWDRGSKDWANNGDYFVTPTNEAYLFARTGGKPNSLGFKWGYNAYVYDFVSSTTHIFYEAVHHTDTVPPEAVTDLGVNRVGNSLAFHWTAPAGGAKKYQLKIMKGKTIAESPDYDYSNLWDSVRVPWWYAANVTGEPVPSAAGTVQGFTTEALFPDTAVYYAAICSRDSSGNLSRLSNVVKIDNTISAEKRITNGSQLFALTAQPNPFNPSLSLAFYVPGLDGQNVSISIYNAQGKLVDKFNGSTEKGCFKMAWDGKAAGKNSVGSGMFLVKGKIGNREIIRRITMLK
ncbi:MAG: hypothetical protein JNL74_10450 [Fibrobacteres bacterium]|nr:hypothetical protein [Fibrobacterota bacterium]